jgi:REP element-mobilizing transposase RayT
MAKSKQLSFVTRAKSEYGGDLQKRRAGRDHARPLSTKETMHLVLRSTKAKDTWSFRHPTNRARVHSIIKKFAAKNHVQVLSFANVGNHLHLHIRLGKRFTYNAFIRSVTGAIASAIAGPRKLRAPAAEKRQAASERWSLKFWDHRPFTRIVQSFRAYKNLKSYVRINQLEGDGFNRHEARGMMEVEAMISAWPD